MAKNLVLWKSIIMDNVVNNQLLAMAEGFLEECKEIKARLGGNQARLGELQSHLTKLPGRDADDAIFSPHQNGRERLEALIQEERQREKAHLEAENQALQQTLAVLDERIKTIRAVISIDPFLNRFQFLDMQEKERQRIARDLHDSSLQNLTHLIHSIELCTLYLDSDLQRTRLELQSVAQKLRIVIDEMRTTIYDLRPMEFDDLGFCEAIRNMVDKVQKETSIFIRLDMAEKISVRNDLIFSNIYRIIRECITNAVKHSGAKEIQIKLWEEGQLFHVRVADDGVGFDEQGINGDQNHFGLRIVRERVQLLKGSVAINSREGNQKGATINIKIPTNDSGLL